MHRLLLLFFLVLSLKAGAQNQYIKGIVQQKNNGKLVENANVYYNSTSIGTQTNSKGEFTLPYKEGKIPIVISCVGFESLVVSNYSPGEVLKLAISVRVNALREVVIGSSALSRKEMEIMFCREFLGSSSNGKKCEIRNLEDVSLHYSAKTKTLSASCSEPLQILNPTLGYEIKYYLDNFIHTPKRTLITGNYVFKERHFGKTDKNVSRNREKAFEGSRMQLMRAVSARALHTTRFKLYNSKFWRISADSILCSSIGSLQELCLRERVIISYLPPRSASAQISYLVQKQPSYINHQGFYDAGIQWTGALTRERIGDLLPFNYQSSPDPSIEDDSIVQKADSIASFSSPELSAVERLAQEVILVPENPASGRRVVKRWHQPVYYKVYGSFAPVNNKSVQDSIAAFCSRLSSILGLEITEAKHDSLANFIIIAGEIGPFKSKIPAEAYNYLKEVSLSGYYYYTSDSGFISMTTYINPESLITYNKLQPVLNQLILKGLGFFGQLNIVGSVFYSGTAPFPSGITNTDMEIMQTLYNEDVKSGITKAELEALLVERRKSASAK